MPENEAEKTAAPAPDQAGGERAERRPSAGMTGKPEHRTLRHGDEVVPGHMGGLLAGPGGVPTVDRADRARKRGGSSSEPAERGRS